MTLSTDLRRTIQTALGRPAAVARPGPSRQAAPPETDVDRDPPRDPGLGDARNRRRRAVRNRPLGRATAFRNVPWNAGFSDTRRLAPRFARDRGDRAAVPPARSARLRRIHAGSRPDRRAQPPPGTPPPPRADDPGDQRAILQRKRQRQAQVDQPRQHPVGARHRLRRRIAPAVVARGEARRARRRRTISARPRAPPHRATTSAHLLRRPVEQQELERRHHVVLLPRAARSRVSPGVSASPASTAR